MLYTITVTCPHCKCSCPWAVSAEVEPSPDTCFNVICPNHGGPVRVPFRYFKPADAPSPNTPVEDYPPKPNLPAKRWWQFWR